MPLVKSNCDTVRQESGDEKPDAEIRVNLVPERVVAQCYPRAVTINRVARHHSENEGNRRNGKDGATDQNGDQAFFENIHFLAFRWAPLDQPNTCHWAVVQINFRLAAYLIRAALDTPSAPLAWECTPMINHFYEISRIFKLIFGK